MALKSVHSSPLALPQATLLPTYSFPHYQVLQDTFPVFDTPTNFILLDAHFLLSAPFASVKILDSPPCNNVLTDWTPPYLPPHTRNSLKAECACSDFVKLTFVKWSTEYRIVSLTATADHRYVETEKFITVLEEAPSMPQGAT